LRVKTKEREKNMSKTIAEINDKIKKGKAVVVTAAEMIDIVAEKGVRKASQEIDVVTTGTFGPMCSSGAFINIGHSNPRIKLGGGTCYLDDVPAYCGLAAVDVYIGATACAESDPRNRKTNGSSREYSQFKKGGAHVIQKFVAGEDVRLVATAYGTDCYPRQELKTMINIKDVNEAILFNPRNAYQNYNVAVNTSDKTIYTYMGVLRPHIANANYCSAGQLSPLLNDPYYRTIGIGTKLFLGGGIGYVAWNGTQHNPTVARNEKGIPTGGAGTLSLIGDLKQMKPEWLVGVSFHGYGTTLNVGIGIPIPVLDEDIARFTAVKDEDITAPIVDYATNYPNCINKPLGKVSYADLKSGKITVNDKVVPTASLSSYSKAVEIAGELKQWIESGKFLLTEQVAPIPGADSGVTFKLLKEKPI
jgi:uncharacterized protein (DUF39 family)